MPRALDEAGAGASVASTEESPAHHTPWGLGAISRSAPLVPLVQAKRRMELQLPGSAWSAPLQLEAVGTHGLLELRRVLRLPEPTTSPNAHINLPCSSHLALRPSGGRSCSR